MQQCAAVNLCVIINLQLIYNLHNLFQRQNSKWRTSIMKDLIQARTDDVFHGNSFNRRAQTCIFKS